MKVLGQLENATLEILSADPGVTTAGRMYYNTATSRFMLDDGTSKRALLRNDGRCVLGTDASAANNVRFHRSGAAKFQFVAGDDATAEGSLSTSLAQVGFRLESYLFETPGRPAAGNPGRMIWYTDDKFLQVDDGTAWQFIQGIPLPNSVTTAMVQNGAITQAKRAALGQQVSASAGSNFNTTSATPVAVTNLSVTITTTGRPVMLMLIPDGTDFAVVGPQTTGATAAPTEGYLAYKRDTTLISTYIVAGYYSRTYCATGYTFVDFPSAGTYTFSVYAYALSSSSMRVNNVKLVAFEL